MKQILFSAFFIFFIFNQSSVFGEEKLIVGRVENVTVFQLNLKLKAKIDTGAKNSSINAVNIKTFQKHGKTWVSFDIINKKNKLYYFEKEVYRIVKIKHKGAASKKRFVIIIGICMSSVYKEVEVNLVDRTNFNYPVLIGRSFLKDDFIVNPSIKYATTPKCTLIE